MRFIEFKSHFEQFRAFSTQDIRKWDPDFDNRRLVEWQQKNYIHRIINRWYTFAKTVRQEELLNISNRIYNPSYISLEWALSHYRFIPEGVYTITAVSSRKTQIFTTVIGTFSYKHLKPSLMFGYKLVSFEGFTYKLAEPEKVILDFLYLNASINSVEDLEGLRLNLYELKSLLNQQKLNNYLVLFKNKALESRVKILMEKLLKDAEP